jgi:hypothetical protein
MHDHLEAIRSVTGRDIPTSGGGRDPEARDVDLDLDLIERFMLRP